MSFDDVDFREFCHNLPKVELHAHLNGSLSNNTLKQLAEDRMSDLHFDKNERTKSHVLKFSS